jgi:UDP:flavonoid glycosyltransferase YjiC (YdhE family)
MKLWLATEQAVTAQYARNHDRRPGEPNGADLDQSRIHLAGFVPIAELLSCIDLVVSVAGAGTVSAALAAGLPLVLRPFYDDQPRNAAQAAKAGVAVVITDSREAGAAVTTVLSTPSYAAAARSAAAAVMDPPQHALRVLLDRV